jgi:hypothetical protein
VSALALKDLMLIRKEKSAFVFVALSLALPLLFAEGSAFALALAALVWAAMAALGTDLAPAGLFAAALLSLAETMILVGPYLAAYYVVGYQNARWAIILIIGLGSAAAGALGSTRNAGAGGASPADAFGVLLSGGAGTGFYLAAVLAALAVYAVSYLVSVAAYRRKQI